MDSNTLKKMTKNDLVALCLKAEQDRAQLEAKITKGKRNRPDFTLPVDEIKGFSVEDLVAKCLDASQLVTYGDAFYVLFPDEKKTMGWSKKVIDAFEDTLEGSSALIVNAQGGYGSRKVVDNHNQWLATNGVSRIVPFMPSRVKMKKKIQTESTAEELTQAITTLKKAGLA